MTASPTSVILAVAVCATVLFFGFLWWRRARRAKKRDQPAPAPVTLADELKALSVHDKPTIEFSAYLEQLGQTAANDLLSEHEAPTRAFAAFDDRESTTAVHTPDASTMEKLRGPRSGIVPRLGRDALQTRELRCAEVDIDEASTGLPRPSALARARARELVSPFVPKRKSRG